MPDTYMRHGHVLFSVESQYSTGPCDGQYWAPEAEELPQSYPQESTQSDCRISPECEALIAVSYQKAE